MNTLLGWYNFNPTSESEEDIANAMAKACRFEHMSKVQKIDKLKFSISSKIAGHTDVFKDEDVVVIIVFSGVSSSLEKGSAQRVAFQYKSGKLKALASINKSFACIILDRKEKKLFLAIDRIGVCNLSYVITDDCIVFATTIDMLLAHPGVKRKIRNQSIYNYLHFHVIPSPQTIYEDICKLQSASYLEITETKEKLIDNYWQPDFDNKQESSSAVLRSELNDVLHQSVAVSSSGKNEGSFLSGGLDSSTISGLLHSVNNTSQAFSIGFGEEGYDEIEYARLVAKHFGIELNEYYVTKQDVLDVIPVVAKTFDEPFGNSSAIPVYYCAKLAKENNCSSLFAGDGGDELFAGNERYRTQLIYELYGKLPQFTKKLFIEPICNNQFLKHNLSIIRKGKSYIEEAGKSVPARMDRYSIYNIFPDTEIYTEEFLDEIHKSEPLRLREELYNQPRNADVVDRMLYVDWKHTLADNDLRKVNYMCAVAGIEVSYPMLSNEMLEFSTRIPSREKITLKNLRKFYKSTFRDYLPSEVISKTKHGFGLPFGVWMRTSKELKSLADESLSSLNNRKIFRTAFLNDIQSKHEKDHASFYGELIWVLMLLEQWMLEHDC